MRYRVLLTLGWLWPFVVAGIGVFMIAAGQRLQGDIAWILLLLTALLGSPAVIATLTYCMPDDWHPVLQSWVTALLAVAVVAAELYLAMCLLAWGANVAGPGLIE